MTLPSPVTAPIYKWGEFPPLITRSPTKNGSNHHITNKKLLKSPYHQQKMAQITITKCPLRSPITKQKASNHHTFFSAQTEVSFKKWQILAPFLLLLQIWNNHQITDKNSSITITTTSQNHQITTFLRY